MKPVDVVKLTVAFLIVCLLVAGLMVGCAVPKYIFVPVALPLPAKPTLPTVTAAELQCLPDDVVDRIEARDDLRRQDQDELRAIIESTRVK